MRRFGRDAGSADVLSATTPVPEIADEAERLISATEELGIPLRLMGGLAVQHHCRLQIEALAREPNDIDMATLRGQGRAVNQTLPKLGYEPNVTFNTMNSGRRALFYDRTHGRQVDVFVGSFQMCHEFPITERIFVEPRTLPLAELLLTKLQIVELNEKDQRDILRLLIEHDVGDTDVETINAPHIASLCAGDWGLWRTCQLNIERSEASLGSFGLDEEARTTVRERLTTLWKRIEAEPKSARWRLRGRIGDRKRWYQLPDEVG